LGLLAVLFVPVFWVGFPVLILTAFTPFAIYFLVRRGKLLETPTLKNKLSDDPAIASALPQDDGMAIKITPAGVSSEDRQKNLIRARRAEAFVEMKNLIGDGAEKRAEMILLDYTRDHVAARMSIDGAWHPLPPLTRQTGDSMLVGLKFLAGLNPADRRGRQQGQFNVVAADKKLTLDLTTQGVKTGERAQLKFIEKRKSDLSLPQVGMWPEMIETLVGHTRKPGIVLVSAPPGNGLTTTWRAVLGACDRITRDWVCIIENEDNETDVENVAIHRFDPAAGSKKLEATIRRVLLSQPDAVVFPDVKDAGTMDKLVAEAVRQDRTILTRIQAKSAAEALVKLYSLAGAKPLFAQAINCVIGQRLARRLCDACKVPVQVKPQLIQQLGGDPRKSTTLYQPYRLPPIEQRVDENGKPIEMFPCAVCSGIGYIGRVSIFEIINVTSDMRSALLKQPQASAIRSLADEAGELPMLKQGYRLAMLGITSVAEIQRVLKD
jgi:type II secretory ATPase GspE/PulE/Tfp pilus assembly ATPase PilB-like protein